MGFIRKITSKDILGAAASFVGIVKRTSASWKRNEIRSSEGYDDWKRSLKNFGIRRRNAIKIARVLKVVATRISIH
jgi:hypothetical protein